MKLMFGLLVLLIAATVVILYAGSYGKGAVRRRAALRRLRWTA
jgi:hypothetical protein